VALTDKMRVALDLYVRGPLKYMDALKEKRQDTKTGLLMYGPAGGGKTVGVSLCEFQAIVSGAVVIHVDPAMGVYGLDRANTMAVRLMETGQTVMISFEDMEKLADESSSKVLEILDGAQAKNAKRIIVGTTNFIEGIDRAMITHGRFDDVLYCGLPDRSAFEQVIRVVFDADNLGEIDFDAAFPHFEGYSYATITNAGSKVIRAAINRLDGNLTDFKVTTQDLIDAADMVRDQHTLMNEPVEKPSPFIDDWFRARMAEAAQEAAEYVEAQLPSPINYEYLGEIVESKTDSVVEGRLNGAAVGSSRIRTN
jgi:transitional endoplasmic reticulum ATPase